MKTKSWVLAVFYSALLWLIAFSLASCNPVKRVMRDPAKVHQVFTQALRSGIESCVTDTFTVHMSDTLVTTDTSWVFDTHTDTVTVQKPSQIFTKIVTKTIRITDSTVRNIKDISTINILRGDIDSMQNEVTKSKLAKREAEVKLQEQVVETDRWKRKFYLLLFGFSLLTAVWFTRKLWFPLLTKIRI